jgi:hypothetical protein
MHTAAVFVKSPRRDHHPAVVPLHHSFFILVGLLRVCYLLSVFDAICISHQLKSIGFSRSKTSNDCIGDVFTEKDSDAFLGPY